MSGSRGCLFVFRERIGADNCEILECYCSPYYQSTAFFPPIDRLRTRLQLTDEDEQLVKLERLRVGLVAHGCDIESALPLVAQLLGIPPEAGYSPLGLHPLTQKQQTVGALHSLFLAPAEGPPTLLVIEDAHWVDPTTVELLGGVLERLAVNRLLVLMTARPDFRAPWPASEQCTVLHVNHLSPAETETMIRRAAGESAAAASAVDARREERRQPALRRGDDAHAARIRPLRETETGLRADRSDAGGRCPRRCRICCARGSTAWSPRRAW